MFVTMMVVYHTIIYLSSPMNLKIYISALTMVLSCDILKNIHMKGAIMFAVTLPNKIKDVLTEKGMTVYRLAKNLNKEPSQVYRLVNPEDMPDGTNISTLVEIADQLGVSVDRLIGREVK